MKDREKYRQVCEDLVKRFGKSNQVDHTHWLVWTCALAPDAVTDWQPVLELAEQAVATTPKGYRYLNALGAALYRAGRLEEAAQRLREANAAYKPEDEKSGTITYNGFFLALVHHRLGKTSEAQPWLEKARHKMELILQDKDAASLVWNRKLTLQLLCREAEEVLGIKDRPLPERQEKRP